MTNRTKLSSHEVRETPAKFLIIIHSYCSVILYENYVIFGLNLRSIPGCFLTW